jgi:hypothetical protein
VVAVTRWGYAALAALALVLVAVLSVPRSHGVLAHWTTAATWQAFASPGRLSAAHASLENDCRACHSEDRAANAARCVACHAVNPALLERQPTRFHATVGDCRGCHVEHRGRVARPITMDHVALAHLAAAQRHPRGALATVASGAREDVASGMRFAPHPPHNGAMVTAAEASLDCASCHAMQDHHVGMFGSSCASCHGTAAWTIAGYQHPSSRSTDCAQCHRPPPSHSMMHFAMVSQTIARHPEARIAQCDLCHQTTAWNDIRGVGWNDHH